MQKETNNKKETNVINQLSETLKLNNIYVLQVVISLCVLVVVVALNLFLVDKTRNNTSYTFGITFNQEVSKEDLTNKINELDFLKVLNISKVGLFNKQYLVYLNEEISNDQKVSVDAKIKEIQNDATVDGIIKYNKFTTNVNNVDYIIYTIATAVLTILAIYIGNRVSKIFEQNK